MKRYIIGLVLVAFATAITAPAFAQRECGPNSRACTLHHEHCTCGKWQSAYVNAPSYWRATRARRIAVNIAKLPGALACELVLRDRTPPKNHCQTEIAAILPD